jgi:hypothetical protein
MGWRKKQIHEDLEKTLPKLLVFHPPSVLQSRVLSRDERESLQQLCLDVLSTSQRTLKALQVLQEFVRFCQLLSEPQNFVMGPTGVYQEKRVIPRLIRDMEAEKAQELLNLPPRIAYAMVIHEEQGEQSILKWKIRTLELSPEHSNFREMEKLIGENTIRLNYVRQRRQVQLEMRRRQTEWQAPEMKTPIPPNKRRRRQTPRAGISKPPPTWGD